MFKWAGGTESIVSGAVSAADGAAVLLSGGISYWSYIGWNHENQQAYFIAIIVMAGLTVSRFRQVNLHDLDVIMSWPSQIPVRRIAANTAMIVLVLAVFAFACKISDWFSRVWLVATYGISLVFVFLSRVVISLILRKKVRDGTLVHNIAVVGAGNQAQKFISYLATHNFPWQRVVGVFDDRQTRVPCDLCGYSLLGNLNDLVRYVQHGKVNNIVVSLPWSAENRLIELAEKLRDLPVDVYLACDLFGYHLCCYGPRVRSGLPVFQISMAPCSGWNRIVKWLVDKSLSFVLAALLSPVLFVIAAAVKLDSPGPALFCQKRYGFNNRLIDVYKFRTMYHHMRDEEAIRLTSRDDHRVTRIGRFLRRTSLDELPQLLNVLKGDMSLVGPRPHATRAKANGKLYDEVFARYAARHRVKPGITGWAQVKGWRGETESEEKLIKRVEHDLFYIEHWSLWFDVRILAKTIVAVWRNENAY